MKFKSSVRPNEIRNFQGIITGVTRHTKKIVMRISPDALILSAEPNTSIPYRFWCHVSRPHVFSSWELKGIQSEDNTMSNTIFLEVDGDALKKALLNLDKNSHEIVLRLSKKAAVSTALLNVSIFTSCESHRMNRDVSHDIPAFVIPRSSWKELTFVSDSFKPHARVRIDKPVRLSKVIDKLREMNRKAVTLRIRKRPVRGDNITLDFSSVSETPPEGVLEVIAKVIGTDMVTTFKGLTLDTRDLLPMQLLPEDREENGNSALRYDTYELNYGNLSLLSSQTTDSGVCQVTIETKQFSSFLHAFIGKEATLMVGIKDEKFAIFKMIQSSFTTDFVIPRVEDRD